MSEVSKSKSSVAIITFFYREYLQEHEEISLRHLDHYLGRYDRYIVKPPEIKMTRPGYQIKTFPAKYFKSESANGQLLLTKKFYSAFSDYKYILLHELDSIVFSDQLTKWVEKEYDYIGAPWIEDLIDHQTAHRCPYGGVDGVGNGGFSLRKIATFLKVIDSAKKSLPDIARELLRGLFDLRKMRQPSGYFKNFKYIWSKTATHRTLCNEDNYWGHEIEENLPDFKIPSLGEALKFSFEGDAHKCFQRNNRQLPFGVHSWQIHNRDFWEPYLLKE